MAVVLVTGGAGYIGSHACKRLAEAGHTPVCFDSLATGWRDAVRYGPLIEGDLLDPDAIGRALAETRPDAVMHFAARSLVGESVRDPGLYWRVNVGGAANLLDAMRRVGVGALVFSSTAAVYGDGDDALLAEDAPKRPASPYGATKLAIERMIDDFTAACGLRAVIFRYFNVAGADPAAEIGEWHQPETHLAPLVLEAALGAAPELVINGDDYPTPDGTCLRDYLHVCDLAEAHLLGLERLLAGGGGLVANLGVGRGSSVLDMIAAAEAATGLAVPRRIGPRREGDPARLVCDPARAMRELGWRPTRSDVATMLSDAWRWRQRGGHRR